MFANHIVNNEKVNKEYTMMYTMTYNKRRDRVEVAGGHLNVGSVI